MHGGDPLKFDLEPDQSLNVRWRSVGASDPAHRSGAQMARGAGPNDSHLIVSAPAHDVRTAGGNGRLSHAPHYRQLSLDRLLLTFSPPKLALHRSISGVVASLEPSSHVPRNERRKRTLGPRRASADRGLASVVQASQGALPSCIVTHPLSYVMADDWDRLRVMGLCVCAACVRVCVVVGSSFFAGLPRSN